MCIPIDKGLHLIQSIPLNSMVETDGPKPHYVTSVNNMENFASVQLH